MTVLYDTDIIIWILRKKFDPLAFNADFGVLVPACSILSLTEVLSGARKKEHQDTMLFFESVEILNLNMEIARLAGKYRSMFIEKGTGTVDALIAATCRVYGLRLATFNRKHYPMKDIGIITPKKYLI